jgi:hypothetical protein
MEEAAKFHHMHENDAVDSAEDVRVNLEVRLRVIDLREFT